MIEDLPEIREQLLEHWRKIADDLIGRGFRPSAVYETMLVAGIGGCAGIEGAEGAAERLSAMARSLDAKAAEERAALAEAQRATKN